MPVGCGEAQPAQAPASRHAEVLRADALALGLAAALDRVTPALARAVAVFVRRKMWFEFGFARLEDFARERFGRSARWARDLALLGAAFEKMPALADALTGRDGKPSISKLKALALARVACPESLPGWLALAREQGIRSLRRLVCEARAAGSAWPPESGSQEPDGPGESARSGPSAPLSDAGREPDGDDLRLVRYMVPAPVVAAFDEGVELFRAVAGSQTGVASFVEALVGEEFAGLHPPEAGVAPESDSDSRPLGHAPLRAVVEEALARSTGHWSHLPARDDGAWAMALAGSSLSRLQALARDAGKGGPAKIVVQIRGLIGISNQLRCRLGRLLAEMADMDAWSRLRFDGMGHYAEERLGLSRSSAEDLVRAARGLRALPVVRQAYQEGRLGLEAVLQILRVFGSAGAGDRAQRAWVSRAESATIKRLRDESLALRRRAAEAGAGGSAGDGAACGTGAPMPLNDADWKASVRREPGMARRRIARLGALALA
ncbi:MAG TPA: hypothetical protein VFP98_06890, partial [Candidatus Polarisedimenticolia bacterium]|nr:hypothetical protein [Candidatus Polarisedimenticolia bacterium]